MIVNCRLHSFYGYRPFCFVKINLVPHRSPCFARSGRGERQKFKADACSPIPVRCANFFERAADARRGKRAMVLDLSLICRHGGVNDFASRIVRSIPAANRPLHHQADSLLDPTSRFRLSYPNRLQNVHDVIRGYFVHPLVADCWESVATKTCAPVTLALAADTPILGTKVDLTIASFSEIWNVATSFRFCRVPARSGDFVIPSGNGTYASHIVAVCFEPAQSEFASLPADHNPLYPAACSAGLYPEDQTGPQSIVVVTP